MAIRFTPLPDKAPLPRPARPSVMELQKTLNPLNRAKREEPERGDPVEKPARAKNHDSRKTKIVSVRLPISDIEWWKANHPNYTSAIAEILIAHVRDKRG